jgi:hypothetical protein
VCLDGWTKLPPTPTNAWTAGRRGRRRDGLRGGGIPDLGGVARTRLRVDRASRVVKYQPSASMSHEYALCGSGAPVAAGP